ncbi:MAG: porin [Hyphomicrobiaceae bacterium]
MKKIMAGIALYALLGIVLLTAWPVRAADLEPGGDCCRDLEERVAELEATVAKKGNRKLTLTISGQVSRSILMVDGDAAVIDNPNSPTRLRVEGAGRVADGFVAGYVIEFGVGDDVPTVRHSFVFIENNVARFSLGHTSMATDGIADISLANTGVANLPSALFGALIDGPRAPAIVLESKQLHGFIASAAWSAENLWDVALRYSVEIGEVQVAAGVGYGEDVIGKRLSGSASVKHVPTGIFINAAGGRARDVDVNVWHLTGGVERRFLTIGATTGFVEFGKLDAGTLAGDGWGLGVVQAIDGAAADVFMAYRGIEDVDLVHAGMRIKF